MDEAAPECDVTVVVPVLTAVQAPSSRRNLVPSGVPVVASLVSAMPVMSAAFRRK